MTQLDERSHQVFILNVSFRERGGLQFESKTAAFTAPALSKIPGFDGEKHRTTVAWTAREERAK
jgi:hypothetical protein